MPRGINIEKCTVVSPVKLILEGWWSVDHQSTEYLIITRFINPNKDIDAQILEDLSALLINLYEKIKIM